MPGNIAQLEFFFYKAENMEGIFSEAHERAKDGARIKLVVRIVDSNGAISAQVMETRARENMFGSYLGYECNEADFASYLWRWWMARRRKKLGQTSEDAQKRLLDTALSELERTIRSGGVVALEPCSIAPLRLVRRDELHELMETARRAHSVWVFVFKPNGILSDQNKLVSWAA